jgi:hypothetical protein
LEVAHQIGALVFAEIRRPAVKVAASAGWIEAGLEGRRAAIVHERRAMPYAHQARHLESFWNFTHLERALMGQLFTAVARRALGFGRFEERSAALDSG